MGTKDLHDGGAADVIEKARKEGQSMEKLQIVYLPPGDLKPYEKNARPSC